MSATSNQFNVNSFAMKPEPRTPSGTFDLHRPMQFDLVMTMGGEREVVGSTQLSMTQYLHLSTTEPEEYDTVLSIDSDNLQSNTDA